MTTDNIRSVFERAYSAVVRLEDPDFKSRQRQEIFFFSKIIRTDTRAHPTHLHFLARFRISGAVPLLLVYLQGVDRDSFYVVCELTTTKMTNFMLRKTVEYIQTLNLYNKLSTK